jgi:hypothetical protein
MSLFNPIPIVSQEAARAPVADKLAAFKKHKRNLLNKLKNGYKRSPQSQSFDEGKSWRDLTQLARLYFWGEVIKKEALPARDCIKRLRQLARALRAAHGLTRRAIDDGLGDELCRAWFAQKKVSLISAAGIDEGDSSILTCTVDEIKAAFAGLATLETAARAAAATSDVLSKKGRPALLPRDCIQGLARVYRKSTGTKPGRGAGPFADFAYEFMTAVGQTGFDYESLIDAIQEAHRQFNPSWFDETP